MNKKQFSNGDMVFDCHGAAHQYVSQHPSGSGHICLPWFECSDEDGTLSDWTGDPVTLQDVYSDASQAVQKADEKLAELTKKCDAARLELSGIIKERGALDTEIRARAERIKQHEKLRLLDDYLAGKITHFVVAPEYGSTIEVKSVADALKVDDKFARSIKLLTLYGDSKGDIQFRINRYSDGSGNSFSGDAYPFTNEDEAKTFAKELAAKKLAECISGKRGVNGTGFPCGIEECIKTANAYGVPVPPEWNEKIKAYRIEFLRKSAAEFQKKAEEANNAIASINAEEIQP